jgi:hypothetical protein
MAADLKEIYERFLAEEAAIRIPTVSVADRGWFHVCVLHCAIAWSRHPRAGFRTGRGRHMFALHFEGPVETKPVVMFSFRSAVETGEYLFTSFNPAKLPQGLSPTARAALTRLRDLFEAALPHARVEDGMVTVAVRKQPQIDFLPIVDEARRVLDDGNQEFPAVDLSDVALPTEKAALFAGKTTITPSPKRRIRHVPQPVVAREPRFDDESEEPDRGNFLAAQSHRKDEAQERPAGATRKPAAGTRLRAPKPKRPAAKPKLARRRAGGAARPARKGGRNPVGGRRRRRAG